LTIFEINTARLCLRDFQEGDIVDYQRLGQNPEAIKYYAQSVAEWDEHVLFLARLFSTWQTEVPRQNYAFTILISGHFAGVTSIRMDSRAGLQGAVGCGLAYEYWSRGYASEALTAVISFGFDHLGFHRIYAETLSDNMSAKKVLQRLGLRLEGELSQNQYIKGLWRNTLVFGILKEEWRVLRGLLNIPYDPGNVRFKNIRSPRTVWCSMAKPITQYPGTVLPDLVAGTKKTISQPLI